jgi:hypothetical protein
LQFFNLQSEIRNLQFFIGRGCAMTTRERRMSVILIGFILVVGTGFFGYQFVYSPLQTKKTLIGKLDDDIAQLEARKARIEKRGPDLEKWKKLSLPPDKVDPAKIEAVAPGKMPGENARADLAQREYEDELNKMLRASGYAATDVAITPKKPDAKSSPQLANKKPIYTRLQFAVQLKGDLASLVDFMDRFYKVRLLHQIRNLTIIKPLGGDFRAAAAAVAAGGAAPNTPSTDLDVNMTIEALVLDNAEKRTTLLPEKPVDVPPPLSRTDAQYAMIAGKNMFFGLAPISTGLRDGGNAYLDTAPFVRLTGINSGPNGLEATLWDMYHDWNYKIAPHSLGGFKVEATYTLGGRKRIDSERSGKTLALHDANGDIVMEWQIVRIDDPLREVILRDDAKGKYFALHLGDYLLNRKELTKTDLDALGIKQEPPRPKPTVIDPDNP